MSNEKRPNDDSDSDSAAAPRKRQRTSFPKSKIRILLLENVHADAVAMLKAEGFQVESEKGALGEDELVKRIRGCHAIGVRSKTKLTRRVLEASSRLLCTGNFCIGTDAVDLHAAQELGVPCFNAPFSNTRSVAELCVANVVCLARRSFEASERLHRGEWNKSAKGCCEVRGKTIGIVGYGHVGSQVSILCEGLGMNVVFFDTCKKLGLGNARPLGSLEEVLAASDFVTLHVPGTHETKNLIAEKQLRLMRKGACVINYSRGSVVDVDALAAALRDGHIGGAAVDVFPKEPAANGPGFSSPLQGCPNTILTPHIGGSTEEAQQMIGIEVASKIIDFINLGCTEGAVNFPNLRLPRRSEAHHCIIHAHRNVPGVLGRVNALLADVNVSGQVLETREQVGYMLISLDKEVCDEVKEKIAALPTSIRTRALYF